jgi:hypothetical protein
MASGHRCMDIFCPHYRRPGAGRDPVAATISLDPGLRRDDEVWINLSDNSASKYIDRPPSKV